MGNSVHRRRIAAGIKAGSLLSVSKQIDRPVAPNASLSGECHVLNQAIVSYYRVTGYNPLDLHVVGIIQRVQTGVLTWTDLGSGKGDSA